MMMRHRHGFMFCGMITIGVLSTVAVYSMFSGMPPRKQREIKRGLKKAIDDLNELVEDISDTVKNMQYHT